MESTTSQTISLFPVNKEVNVNAFYFASQQGGLKTFPRQIELEGEEYTFMNGLRYLVRRGAQLVQLFDMSDGDNIYRLRLEDNHWTLVGMKAGA